MPVTGSVLVAKLIIFTDLGGTLFSPTSCSFESTSAEEIAVIA